MCGIAGVVALSGRPIASDALHAMSALMTYRGPDDDGMHVEDGVGLANRRLAVLDPTPAGHMPMESSDGRYLITHNGEVYNHAELRRELELAGWRLRSHSDTEVVLCSFAQWGTACLDRFVGMYAFAIWDRQTRRLTLARDRVGIKPLYYARTPDAFVFGSEIKVVQRYPGVGRRIRPQAVADYLAYSHPLNRDRTWFEGIHRVPAGCHATLCGDGRLDVRRYWDPVELYSAPAGSGVVTAAEVRAALEDTVRLHLRSDAPLGAHLSGGLDSSSVVALMTQQLGHPIATFSGAFAEGPRFDERAYIRLVAQRYGTDHHDVVPTATDFRDLLPTLMWHMDEPTAGASAVSQLAVCRLARETGVKVVNGGQGGDELFGGYLRYQFTPQPSRWTRQRMRLNLQPAVFKAHARRAMYSSLAAHRLSGYHRDFARALEGYRPRRQRVIADPTLDEMYFDLMYYLPGLLHVEDRTSMACSLESRVPLLDHRLVELAARIPPSDKMHDGVMKAILREAVQDVVPRPIIDRRDKKGFPTPLGPWMAGELAGWVEDTLRSRRFTESRIFSPLHLSALLRAHRSGLPMTHPLWVALSIAVWLDMSGAEPAW